MIGRRAARLLPIRLRLFPDQRTGGAIQKISRNIPGVPRSGKSANDEHARSYSTSCGA